MIFRTPSGWTEFDVIAAAALELRAQRPLPADLLPPDDALAAHWQRRTAATPSLFNGTVFVMAGGAGGGVQDCAGALRGELYAVEFRTFLYWREVAWNTAVIDAFGSAILITADGDVILGTAGAETINHGKAYFFGGFLDPRDIGPDGMADIRESTARELQEETGLVAGIDVDAAPGYLVARSPQQISFGVVYRAREGTSRVIDRILHHLKHENDQEIAALKVICSPADAADPSVQPFTAAVVQHLFAAPT